ncbi:MAG: hypothetical protein GYB67_15250 [Chloroflexi bacterium]|nr:hypothetical protein [Chloroflexota bacterium]
MGISPRQLAARQLQMLDADARLILIHPNYVQQHLLLSELIDDAVYVRFDGHLLDEAALTAQLETAFAAYGGRKSLNGVGYVILDECDRAVMSDLVCLLQKLIVERPKSRLVVFSRQLPPGLLADAQLRAQTRFVPHNEQLMLWDYAQPRGDDDNLLEVRALGTGRVQLNGQDISQWDGLLPRSLFFYLVDRGMATRSEIFETFWPNLTTREATNVFHVTKRKISEVLGIDLTVYWSGFYHISPKTHLSYDVSLFSQVVQDSEMAEPQAAVEHLQHAVALYRGHFLTALDLAWVERRRADVHQGFTEVLSRLAKLTEELGDTARALGLYLRASVHEPQREDLVLSIMQIYRDLGMYADAMIVYNRLADELHTQFGMMPGPDLQQLADEIQGALD